MTTLNLVANGTAQKRIKDYLEENASEVLADKINSGVKIDKDNKVLLNKKDLNGFMKYATEEARKLAEKGSSYACIEDETVFGWAVHYFEEDSIIGELFNENGTQYCPVPKAQPVKVKTQSQKLQNKQTSLFDLINENESNENEIEEDSCENNEEIEKQEKVEKTKQKCEKYEEKPQKLVVYKDKLVDEDGVILTDEEIETSFDKHTMYMLYSLFDGKLELQ